MCMAVEPLSLNMHVMYLIFPVNYEPWDKKKKGKNYEERKVEEC